MKKQIPHCRPRRIAALLLAAVFCAAMLFSACAAPAANGGATPAPEGSGHSCTLLIECAKIRENIDDLDPEKLELLPDDDMIIAKCTVSFTDGESVYDLLVRETKARKIHMEASYTPVYDSAYIEGIGNLYEFDCGEGSGWTYSVNGVFPNYGCSKYLIHDGDAIEWHYTCDYGRDVGALFDTADAGH